MKIQQMLDAVITYLNTHDQPFNWESEFVSSTNRDEYSRERGYYLHIRHPDEEIKYAGKGSSKSAQYQWQSHLKGKSAGVSFLDVVTTILGVLLERAKARERTVEHLRKKNEELQAIAREMAEHIIKGGVCSFCGADNYMKGEMHKESCPVGRLGDDLE